MSPVGLTRRTRCSILRGMQLTYQVPVDYDSGIVVSVLLFSLLAVSALAVAALVWVFISAKGGLADRFKAVRYLALDLAVPGIILAGVFLIPTGEPQTAASVEKVLTANGFTEVEIGKLPDRYMDNPTVITAVRDGDKKTCAGHLEWPHGSVHRGGWLWSDKEVQTTLKISCYP